MSGGLTSGSGLRMWLAIVAAALLAAPAAASAATYTVDQTTDGAGTCAADPDPGSCTLRQAVNAAGLAAGADTIDLPTAGPYTLTLGQLLDSPATSADPLTIEGTGASRAVINAGNNSRVLDALDSALTLRHLELTGGKVTGINSGGALEFIAFGATDTLTVNDVKVDANQSLGDATTDANGGGLSIDTFPGAPVNIVNSEITNNQAGDGTLSAGVGGGIWLQGSNPQLAISNSSVTGNTATGEAGADCPPLCSSLGGVGGGIFMNDSDSDTTAGSLTMTNSNLNQNVAGPGTNGSGVNSGHSVSSGGGLMLQGVSSPPPAMAVVGGSISSNKAAGGSTDGNDHEGLGGAIRDLEGSASSTISLNGTTVDGNSAGAVSPSDSGTGVGGAIDTMSPLQVTNAHLDGNKAGVVGGSTNGAGGAVAVEEDTDPPAFDAPLTVTGSTISNNTAGSGTGSGGAIDMPTAANLSISSSTLDGNHAAVEGGAINRFVASTAPSVTDQIQTSDLSNNSAPSFGGAIELSTNASFQITRSNLSGNSADATVGGGGAIDAKSSNGSIALGSLGLTNSTLSGNSANVGGAINTNVFGSSFPINASLSFATVAGNSGADGANIRFIGLPAPGGTPPALEVKGSVISGHSGGGADCTVDPIGQATVVDHGGSITDEPSPSSCRLGSGPGDLTGVNPLLDPLASNGGPTVTRALQLGSPAIDAIPAAVCAGVAVDQRGVARPQGPACDSGAFELVPAPAQTVPGTQTPPGSAPPNCEALRKKLKQAHRDRNKPKVRKLRRKLKRLGC